MTPEAGGELAAGMRPAPLWEPLSQGNIMRHAVGDYEHYAPSLPVLDVPLPQTMEIQQRTVDDMLQDTADRVQQRVAPLAAMVAVPRPVPQTGPSSEPLNKWAECSLC